MSIVSARGGLLCIYLLLLGIFFGWFAATDLTPVADDSHHIQEKSHQDQSRKREHQVQLDSLLQRNILSHEDQRYREEGSQFSHDDHKVRQFPAVRAQDKEDQQVADNDC